jgi:hypothetical protein
VLALVTIMLIRSMSRRIRRLPTSFDASRDASEGKRRHEEKAGSDAADAGDARA